MMSKKEKFYVVWFGNPAGIFGNWEECKRSIEGVKGAQYKSFSTFAEAKIAYNKEYTDYKGKSETKKLLSASELAKIGDPNLYSIAVDAASSGNPGIMEYRGVETQTHKQLFHQGPFQQGTNNVGEFLALVHGLAFLKDKKSARILYTDSRIAMGWIKKKKCNTKLKSNMRVNKVFNKHTE